MAKYLVIVESPAKSKTIEKYLGSDYEVTSSKGHIRDLKTRGYGGFGVDIENNFQPMYKLLVDKTPVIRELKKMSKNAEIVYLATDPDREGEAISWHLYDVLGLEKKNYQRIVFNEITKTAVTNALKNGRDIDMDLVHSQESRRILDRIIGFSLSKLLQRKIGSKSAGRVQSVALKIICDREQEVQDFIPEEFWEVFLEGTKKASKIKAKLISHNDDKVKLSNKSETDYVLSQLVNDYVVSDIVTKEREKSAKPPFITSTLQQDASTKFNFNSRKTMMIAQGLYEGVELGLERVGLITYMRTDSIRLSDDFIKAGKAKILKDFGPGYYKGYSNGAQKGKHVQDAHEAIRPTDLKYTPEYVKQYLSNDEYKIYSMIYFRALASLMSNAVIEDQKIKINNNGYIFEANGEKIIFDGYLRVYGNFENDSEKSLPIIAVGDVLKNPKVTPEQKFTNPPLRYSEARLIKRLEELGIGRPSTYAATVETLKQRNYAKVEKKVFVPTHQGMLTSQKLQEYFGNVINVKYTADMEETLDKISEGNKVWYKELAKYYDDFMPLVSYADENMQKIYPIYLEEKCPNCGSPLVMRNGRFGEFAACSGFPKCRFIKKPEKEEPETTGIKCPNCKDGMIVERLSKKGRNAGKKFYACNKYPTCKSTYSTLEEIPTYQK